MTYNSTAEFYSGKKYNESTSVYSYTDVMTIKHLDIRTSPQKNMNDKTGHTSRSYISVKSQKPFPKDALMRWKERTWKVIPGSLETVDDNRRRKWYSVDYVEVGGEDLNGGVQEGKS